LHWRIRATGFLVAILKAAFFRTPRSLLPYRKPDAISR